MIKIAHWPILASVVLLGACGGNRPSIQIRSHSNGQVVANGDRNIIVSGTGSRIASVQVKLNGAVLPASAVSSTTSTFTANLTLGNNSNTIEAIASHSDGSTSSGVVTVVYPFATFTTFQNASVVIGQANFEQNGDQPPAADTISFPSGRALVSGGKLYLPDQGNSRVLAYDSVPATNGAAANLVLGQSDFTSDSSGPPTAAQWDGPQTAVAESGNWLVVDTGARLVRCTHHRRSFLRRDPRRLRGARVARGGGGWRDCARERRGFHHDRRRRARAHPRS
jgi:hypothetical protein